MRKIRICFIIIIGGYFAMHMVISLSSTVGNKEKGKNLGRDIFGKRNMLRVIHEV